MRYERAIAQAVDRLTGELLKASEIFKDAKTASVYRRQYNENKIVPFCRECEQNLQISKSRLERHYFKHGQDSDYCWLKETHLSESEAKKIADIICAKESDRHKFLKHKIAELLKLTEDIDPASVFTDDRFIYDQQEKRRPDVYCRYKGHELVFEIQLSDLSYRYILDRHNFYQRKGIYLIWILDKFDVHGQSSMEKDIKYLNVHQNFFKLDEVASTFRLVCTYKKPVVQATRVITPWQTTSVALSDIKFNNDAAQVYYFDFEGKNKTAAEKLRQAIARQRQLEEDQRRQGYEEEQEYDNDFYQSLIDDRVKDAIETIKTCRKRGVMAPAEEMLNDFAGYEMEALNEQLAFNERRSSGLTAISHYLLNAQKTDLPFLRFLLKERRIAFDVNRPNEDSTTTFQSLIYAENLSFKEPLLLYLFMRGYRLTKEDIGLYKEACAGKLDAEKELVIFDLYQKAPAPEFIQSVYEHKTLFLTLESIAAKKITGLGFSNWISVANYAITTYKSFWSLIEQALRKGGIWDLVIAEDKKKTFDKKLLYFRDELPDQDNRIRPVCLKLYPELFG